MGSFVKFIYYTCCALFFLIFLKVLTELFHYLISSENDILLTIANIIAIILAIILSFSTVNKIFGVIKGEKENRKS